MAPVTGGRYLDQAGGVIGKRDLMIAATALSRELLLIARDQRSYSKIPGLKMEVV